jgi:hypothetical protein
VVVLRVLAFSGSRWWAGNPELIASLESPACITTCRTNGVMDNCPINPSSRRTYRKPNFEALHLDQTSYVRKAGYGNLPKT